MHYTESMKRSISMPHKPRNDEPSNNLKRSNETEQLYTDDDENDDDDDEYAVHRYRKHQHQQHHNNNMPSTSKSTEDHIKLKYYTKDDRKKKWYGSGTIEIQSNETLDKNHDNNHYYKKTDNILNEYNSEKRLIAKNGYQNVNFIHVPKRSVRYFKDCITTLIEQNWIYTLTLFTVSFFASWFIFACLWYLIAIAHGDLDFDPKTGQRLGDGLQPCVHGVTDMMGMFVHSLELQSTIGFGEKYPTEECPEGILLYIMQVIISIGFEGAMVSVMYAKLARPLTLISKLTFSKNACVYLRDGKLCLIFRVCDPREQKTISNKIRVYVVLDITTLEGETMKIHKELKIENNGTSLMMWPETICHIIDRTSPFYKYTANDFHTKNYEIFVSLVGHSPTTGLQTESRTSYLPQEIIWGERFVNVISFNRVKQTYIIDYDNFHTTVSIINIKK